MSILQKIKDIEDEMARTQRNKATAGHLGLLKAKLAKYRRELLDPSSGASGGGKGEGTHGWPSHARFQAKGELHLTRSRIRRCQDR